MTTLEQKQEALNKLLHDLQEYYDGKKAFNGTDDEGIVDRMLADVDKLSNEIKGLQKFNEVRQWASTVQTALPINADPEADKKASSELQMQAFRKYITGGKDALNDAERKTLTVGTDASGGYMVAPEQFHNELIKAIDKQTYAMSVSRIIPVVGAESLGVPVVTANISNYSWTTEVEAITPTDATTGKRTLTPHPVRKAVSASKYWRNVATMADQFLMEQLALIYAYTIETAWISGSGSGEPLGMFTADANGITTSQDVETATAVTIAYDDVVNTFFGLRPVYQSRATWVVSNDFVKICRKLKDAANHYVWQPDMMGANMVNGNPGTILGRPYICSEFVTGQTAGAWTNNQYVAVVGDLSNYWWARSGVFGVSFNPYLYEASNYDAYFGTAYMDGMPVWADGYRRMKAKSV
jgi:HK97 family phage major capsid protein